jgi:hypothetical protein
MSEDERLTTTIKVRKATLEVLKSIGRKGETYDDIIQRLFIKARIKPKE